MKILITGGAGFIGVNLARRLLAEGCTLELLDNFSTQVHGDHKKLPADIADHVVLRVADVRDREQMSAALKGKDAVVHLAAETGTGQSMYEVQRYQEVNVGGTAVLMDLLVNERPTNFANLVVASSRAIYGEGAYLCASDGMVFPPSRGLADLQAGRFDPRCPQCGASCAVCATPENAPMRPASFYGLTKQIQEQMALMFGEQIGFNVCALRYQNVYGPGQSLKNPYTGILAIFSNQARNGSPINVFEDGKESRDFVYIDDVVEATWLALHGNPGGQWALNVGSGVATSVLDVAQAIVEYFSSKSQIKVTGDFRQGDIRHNLADLQKIKSVLGFTPRWGWRDGLSKFLFWAGSEPLQSAQSLKASLNEMADRGLFHSK